MLFANILYLFFASCQSAYSLIAYARELEIMLKNLILLAVCLFAVNAVANTSSSRRTRIVYGQDNRVDIVNVHDARITKLAKAVAGRVFKYSYEEATRFEPFSKDISFSDVLRLSDPDSMNVCKSERFAYQPTVADCTGFLVGENLLVTAGHCMLMMGTSVEYQVTSACENNSWMFDYQVDSKGKVDLKAVKSENLYDCKQVIYGKYTVDEDFALVELTKKVTNREPLTLNKTGSIQAGTKLFVMGHPSGLPLKYSDGARVFEVENNYFTTNLDTFGGNSGSPVFNAKTLAVEGILVRGDIDYVFHRNDDGSVCSKVNVCDSHRENCIEDDENIKGEHVSIIKPVADKVK